MNINRFIGIFATTGALLSTLMVGASAANASEKENATQQSFTSESCLTEVRAIAAKAQVNASSEEAMCAGTVTTSESAPHRASVAQVEAYVSSQQLGAAAAQPLLAAAEAGNISYRTWTHTYWGGAIVEKHEGTTYWGNGNAWIATHDGYTGNHTCHSQGSWAVGMAVTGLECTNPGPGANAIATHRFDVGAAYAGSPVSFTVGLHYQTNSDGTTIAWQVGG